MNRSVRHAVAGLATTALLALAAAASPPVRPLPPIVFVSRAPVPGDPLAVPGLGPHHRADRTGGRLLRRDPDGSVRDLLPPGAMFDVSDPSVSPDAGMIVFAGAAGPDSAWRIYRCTAAGGGLQAVTTTATEFRAPNGGPRLVTPRGDDLDPCWISSHTLCFASTCGAPRSEYADVPATNLFLIDAAGGPSRQLTADRNGAEEPAYDPVHDRIVYTRWWFNARMPSRIVASGLTRVRADALGADTVNVWQAVTIDPRGRDLRLAAGAPLPRRAAMGYQPCVLRDGDVVAVYALDTGLSPRCGPTGVHVLSRSLRPSVRLAGLVTDADEDPAYGTPRGLAASAACSPAALPDGRILVAYDPGARGDFGISVIDGPGMTPAPVVDRPGTLELDPAPIAAWPRGSLASGPAAPFSTDSTFTFFCRNLFATGPLDGAVGPPPPASSWPLRVRFYASRPISGDAHGASSVGDTAVLVRESAVRDDGSVFETGLPAGVPMFEQIVDATGLPLATAHGGTQVPGFNYGAPGAVVRCLGCHTGHSTLAASGPDARFRRIDVAPLAELSASSRAPGMAGPGAAADGRTRGDAARIAWVAAGDSAEWLALAWAVPVRVDRVELWLPADDAAKGTALRLEGCRVELTHKGVRTAHGTIGALAPGGAGIATGGVYCDRLELDLGRARGNVLGRRRVALAEVEVLGVFAPEGLNWPAGPRSSATTP